jgi:nitrogen fixation/metabolism regulation signal transduction histidine kinase
VSLRRIFLSGLLWRVALLLLAMFALVEALSREGFGAVRLLTGLICLGLVFDLWRFVQRTNRELARFVDAVRFGDLSQNFAHRGGSGFGELGDALEQGIRMLREERHRLSDSNRFYEAVLDAAPTALIAVQEDGGVELVNQAARRLLNRHSGVRIEDFRAYGDAFVASLADVAVGRPRIVPLTLDAAPQAAMVSAARVRRLGGSVRVIAVQPIQGELNAVEIAAQSDIVRVLTHEIMNSITPVTSLAHTAASLIANVDDGQDERLSDARTAVETLARRAGGMMHFVESYRQIARVPELRRRRFEALPWARELETLFRASEAAKSVSFTMEVTPDTLCLDVDPDLMSQVILNLLKNGAEAARDHQAQPAVRLDLSMTEGGRAQIQVSDNGPGIPESLQRDVFLPFFTTKPAGTGVGLSLARQIVLAHGGSISFDRTPDGSTQFQIVV